jgi:hypothetical protein
MRCRYCGERSGLLRRQCEDCGVLLDLYERHRGELGLSQLVDHFIASGVARAKIEAVLVADPDGEGALRDRVTADMANRLLADMGVTPRQTAADVRRLRERGGGSASTVRPGPPPTRRGSS